MKVWYFQLLLYDYFLQLCSVIGAVLIVGGLYMVLWGKSKEMKKMSNLVSSEITQEREATEVVVISKTTNIDNSDCNNNNTRTH